MDTAVDQALLRTLHGRSSWAVTPELMPSADALAACAGHLTAKIETYDAHIGAAKADETLSKERAGLLAELTRVRAIQEHGAFAVAKLDIFAREYWCYPSRDSDSIFTDLGRALLVTYVESHRDRTQVFIHFEEDTTLYRTLYAKDLREEIAATRARLHALENEHHELGVR